MFCELALDSFVTTGTEMRLIAHYYAIHSANDAARLLEANGIAAFISNKRSFMAGSYRTGGFSVGLWAVLDEQYDDAVELLANPGHSVRIKLSATELTKVRASVREPNPGSILPFLFKLLAIMALIALTILYLTQF